MPHLAKSEPTSHRLRKPPRPGCVLPGCALSVPRPFFIGYCAPHRCEDLNHDGTQCMAPCRVWRVAELSTSHSSRDATQPARATYADADGGVGFTADRCVYFRYVLSPFCRFHEPERMAAFSGLRMAHVFKQYPDKVSSLRTFYRRQMCMHADHGGKTSTVRAFRTEDARVEDGIVTLYPTCWEHLPGLVRVRLLAEGIGRGSSPGRETESRGSDGGKDEMERALVPGAGKRGPQLLHKRTTIRAIKEEGEEKHEDIGGFEDQMDWVWEGGCGGRADSVVMLDLGRQGLA